MTNKGNHGGNSREGIIPPPGCASDVSPPSEAQTIQAPPNTTIPPAANQEMVAEVKQNVPPKARARRKGDVTRMWLSILLGICVLALLGIVYYQRTIIWEYQEKYGMLSEQDSNRSPTASSTPVYTMRVLHPPMKL